MWTKLSQEGKRFNSHTINLHWHVNANRNRVVIFNRQDVTLPFGRHVRTSVIGELFPHNWHREERMEEEQKMHFGGKTWDSASHPNKQTVGKQSRSRGDVAPR